MAAPANPLVGPERVTRAPSRSYVRSYWKTVLAAALLAGGCGALMAWLVWLNWAMVAGPTVLARLAWVFMQLVLGGVACWALLLAAGGLIAIRRDALQAAGRPYDGAPREVVPGSLGSRLRSLVRRRGSSRAPHLVPGDDVEIRSLEEILATLDDQGTLDGLPFMPEMAALCGSRAPVFRRVDKLNDWVHAAGLRRVRGTVQLHELRCDGSAHGGCQSNCRFRWKEAWLRRAGDASPKADALPVRLGASDLARLSRREGADEPLRYRCQATELAAGCEPLRWNDLRHFLRDFTSGNVRLGPLLTGVALTCFNWVQWRRGGVMFPRLTYPAVPRSPTETLGLQPGERVRIKTQDQISETLNDRQRNRGLYFDRDMLRFCGGEYTVRAVLHRVIVESTGVLKELATPAIVLEGVRATGEYRGFNPEDEHIFWREIWLERVEQVS